MRSTASRVMPGMVLPVAVLVAAGGVSIGGGLATTSQGDIRFSMDSAIFDMPSSDSMAVEVYFQLEAGQLAGDEEGRAAFETTVTLESATTPGVTDSRDWISEVEQIEEEGRHAVNMTMFAAPPGDYLLTAVITDLENGLSGSAQREITIPESLVMSELELASALVPAREGSTSPLLKGSVIVFPAADNHFVLPSEARAYVYAELYTPGDTVSVRTTFLGASGEPLFQRPWRSLAVPEGASAVGLFDSLEVNAAMTSGLHYIEMALVAGGDTLVTRKPVMLSRDFGDDTASQQQGPDEQEGPMPIDELRLLLTRSEESLLDRMDSEEALRQFYTNYWTGRAEEREEFERRCSHVTRFTTPFDRGFETDMGRVYIIYGPPDDIESITLETDVIPHEVWKYYTGGGDSFVFADMDGSGAYEQIYSSVEGEISYEGWQEMLMPIGAGF